MKNNLWDKKIIEFNDVHNFHCKLVYLTRVYFFFNQMFF